MTRVIYTLVGIVALAIGVGWLAGHPGWGFVTFGGMIVASMAYCHRMPRHGGIHPSQVPPKFRGGRLQA
jgi:hypothetical protein